MFRFFSDLIRHFSGAFTVLVRLVAQKHLDIASPDPGMIPIDSLEAPQFVHLASATFVQKTPPFIDVSCKKNTAYAY